MQNNSEKTSHEDVIPSVAKFLGRYDKEDFIGAPVTMQEMFNEIMATDVASDIAVRQRMLNTLAMIQDFGNVLQPFSDDAIRNAYSYE